MLKLNAFLRFDYDSQNNRGKEQVFTLPMVHSWIVYFRRNVHIWIIWKGLILMLYQFLFFSHFFFAEWEGLASHFYKKCCLLNKQLIYCMCVFWSHGMVCESLNIYLCKCKFTSERSRKKFCFHSIHIFIHIFPRARPSSWCILAFFFTYILFTLILNIYSSCYI